MSEIEWVERPTAQLVKTNATDDDVALAAWVSFAQNDTDRLSDRNRVEKLIKFLYNNKHMSPFEHGSWTFMIDCPIFVAREFHRHRTMSYNEVSGRYTEFTPRFYRPGADRPLVQQGKPGAYYFVPGEVNQLYETNLAISHITNRAWEEYQGLIGEGVAKEVARMVLPNNLMTQFYATVNTRNLMHFLDLRTDETALHEIRLVANDMEKIFAEGMPLTYKAYIEHKYPLLEVKSE